MKKSKTQTLLLSFVGFSLFFFVLNRIFFFSPTFLETGASYLMYPVILVQHRVLDPLKKRTQMRSNLQQLCQENQCLLAQNYALQAENIELKASATYMNDIKEILDFKNQYQTDYMLLVHVILKHCADDAHYVLVDVGSDRGVAVDMVAVYKNCLVGRVTEVYPHISKIMLTTDQRCKVASVCLNTNVHGLHEGSNSCDVTKLTHVSHLLKLEDNDLILSSGEGLVFPQGFGLGKIQSYELDGVQYRVTVQPLIDIHTIDYCFLIKKKNEH